MTDKIGKPIIDEIATTEKDIDLFAGWLTRLENPDPVLRTEAGGKGLKLYDEIDRDAHAGAVLQTRYLSVVGREWEILPAAEAMKRPGRRASVTQEQKIADFVKEVFLNCNFDQGRQEQLQAILYGYYPVEIMWEASEGVIFISKLLAKHPRRFVFTPDRELRLLTLASMIEGEPLPDRKIIPFTYGSSDNPYGCGLGRRLWWPVWFKKNNIKFWLVFLEKFGMPTAIGKYPPGTDKTQQDTLLNAIDAIQNESGIKIPDSMAIEFLEAARTGTASYETLCDYMDRQISKAVLGQTLTTEVKGEGSYAASQTHEGVRQDIVKADADALCECYNATLVRWIVDYNFGPQREYPKIWIRCEDEEDLKPLAERDKIILVDMGMGKRVPESYITETYGIPLAEDGEVTIGAPPAADEVEGSKLKAEDRVGNAHQFAEGDGKDIADLYADRAGEEAARLMDGLMEPVRQLVEKAGSLEEIRDGLLKLAPDVDSTQFGELMARAMLVADLAGRYEVREGK